MAGTERRVTGVRTVVEVTPLSTAYVTSSCLLNFNAERRVTGVRTVVEVKPPSTSTAYVTSSCALLSEVKSYVPSLALLSISASAHVLSSSVLSVSNFDYALSSSTLLILDSDYFSSSSLLSVSVSDYFLSSTSLAGETAGAEYVISEAILGAPQAAVFLRSQTSLDTPDLTELVRAEAAIAVSPSEFVRGAVSVGVADFFAYLPSAASIIDFGERDFVVAQTQLIVADAVMFVKSSTVLQIAHFASYLSGSVNINTSAQLMYLRSSVQLRSYLSEFLRSQSSLLSPALAAYARSACTLFVPGALEHIGSSPVLFVPGQLSGMLGSCSLSVEPGSDFVTVQPDVQIVSRDYILSEADVSVPTASFVRSSASLLMPLITGLISCDYSTKRIYFHQGISGIVLANFTHPANMSPQAVAITESRQLLSAGENKIFVYQGLTSTVTASFSGPGGGAASGMAVSAIGNLVTGGALPGGGSRAVFIHSGLSSTVTSSFPPPVTSVGHNNPTGVGIASTGNLVSAVTGGSWWGDQSKISIHAGITETVTASWENSQASGSWLVTDVTVDRISDTIVHAQKNPDTGIYVHNGLVATIQYSFSSPGPEPSGLAVQWQAEVVDFIRCSVPMLWTETKYVRSQITIEPLAVDHITYYRDARDFLGVAQAAGQSGGNSFGVGWDDMDPITGSGRTDPARITYYDATHLSYDSRSNITLLTQNIRTYFADTYLNSQGVSLLDQVESFVDGYYYMHACVKGSPEGDNVAVYKITISGNDYPIKSASAAWTWRLLSESPIWIDSATMIALSATYAGISGIYGIRGIYLTNTSTNPPANEPYGDGGDANRDQDKLFASDVGVYLTTTSAEGDPQSNPNLSLGYWRSSTVVADNILHNLFDAVTAEERQLGDWEVRCLAIKNNHPRKKFHTAKFWRVLSADSSISFALEHPKALASPVGSIQWVLSEDETPGTGIPESSVSGDASDWSSAGSLGDAADLGFGIQHIGKEHLYPGETVFIWVQRLISSFSSFSAGENVILYAAGNYDRILSALTVIWDVGAAAPAGDLVIDASLAKSTQEDAILDLSIQIAASFNDARMDLAVNFVEFTLPLSYIIENVISVVKNELTGTSYIRGRAALT